MDRLFFSLLTLALQWFRPRYNAHLQLLQAQIRILRSRIDVSRIVPTPKEKAELLRIGALLGHDVTEVMHAVQPETYRRWVRQSKRVDVFKIFWRSEGARCIRISLKAPMANAFTETWIEAHKRECLNHFMCFSLDQLDYITRTWGRYYNTLRPHRGIGMKNEVLDKTFVPQSHGAVRCRQQLGGVIRSYYREAASALWICDCSVYGGCYER